MKIDKFYKKFGWLTAPLILIMNIIAYSFLPKTVTIKISFNGTPEEGVSKLLFVFLLPLVSGLLYLYNRSTNKKILSAVLSDITFIAVNILILIFNLK